MEMYTNRSLNESVKLSSVFLPKKPGGTQPEHNYTMAGSAMKKANDIPA